MASIFSLKAINDNPADGISNANRAIFGRINSAILTLFAFCSDDFNERGAIKKIDQKYNSWLGKFCFLWLLRPDYLLGIGSIREIPYILFRPRKTRYVIAWHTVLFKQGEAWDVKTPWFVRKFIFNRASFILTVSEFASSSIRRYFPRATVYVVLNGTDLEMFNRKHESREYLAKEYGIDFSKPIIAFVGALQTRKRPDIFAALAPRYPGANFIMVGRRAEEWPFLNEAMWPANFKWIARMPPREDVGRFLASSQLFVFPSVNEASAAVIIESMASGCVPIVSRSGGNTEFFVEGESGVSVPVDTENLATELDGFSKKIGDLIGDKKKLQMLSMATRREAEKHSWQVVADRYREIFTEPA